MMRSFDVRSCKLLCVVLFYCLGIDCAFKTIVLAQSAAIRNVPATNAASEPNATHNGDWAYIGTKGGIETYLKKVEGSDLLATRGVAYLDMHISQAMGPYINLSMAYNWVSMLKHIQQYPINDGSTLDQYADEDMVYQILELPWPVAPRDVVLHRKFSWDPVERTVTVNYHSIEDDRCPRTPGTVRADSPHSMWRFRSVPSCDHKGDDELPPVSTAQSRGDAESSRLQRLFAMLRRHLSTPNKTGVFHLSVLFARRGLSKKNLEGEPQKVRLGAQRGLTPVDVLPGQAQSWLSLLLLKARTFRASRGVSSGLSAEAGRVTDSAPQSASRSTHTPSGLVAMQCSTSSTPTPFTKRNSGLGRSCGKCSEQKWRGVGTVIEFESFVDSHGSVPTWLINHLQRSFPAQALTAYRLLAEKQIATPYEKVLDW